MSGPQIILVGALLVTVVAALWDYKTGLIPNVITYPLFVVGAIAHVVMSAVLLPPEASVGYVVLETLAGAVVCGLVPYVLWRKQAMGGGDVKLLVGLGALLGPALGLQLELYAFIAGLLVAPLMLAHRGVLLATIKRSFALLLKPFMKKPLVSIDRELMTEVRFGPAIFLGTACVVAFAWRG